MELNISFTDFWEGHDPKNNLLTNVLVDSLNVSVNIVEPKEADICFVTVYGSKYREILRKYAKKSILWLGENIRPNTLHDGFSITFDFHSYGGKNFRLPLWMSEIDWFSTGLGVIQKNNVKEVLCETHIKQPFDIENRGFCITIFNNPEGTRIELLRLLNQIRPVVCFGKPFGNWFPTNETYQSKLQRMGSFLFNLCPENSLYPGYYTEKCFHAKVAGCIPIYMADSHVKSDFRVNSFINLVDFPSADKCIDHIQRLLSTKELLYKQVNSPLLYKMPSLDNFAYFLNYACNSILSRPV